RAGRALHPQQRPGPEGALGQPPGGAHAHQGAGPSARGRPGAGRPDPEPVQEEVGARDPGRARAAGYQGAFSSTNRPPRTTATYVRGWSTSRALVMLILPSGVWKFLIVLSASVILVRCVRMLSPPARLARRIASATTCAPAYAWAAN